MKGLIGCLRVAYRSCFPLPYEASLHDRLCVLRLDRTQPIPRHLLKVCNWRLTPEWTLYLQEWARFHLTGRLGDDETDKNPRCLPSVLKVARKVLMEESAKARAHAANRDQ